jgi:hypothetical protein
MNSSGDRQNTLPLLNFAKFHTPWNRKDAALCGSFGGRGSVNISAIRTQPEKQLNQ